MLKRLRAFFSFAPEWAQTLLGFVFSIAAGASIILIFSVIGGLPLWLGLSVLFGESFTEATASWWEFENALAGLMIGLTVMGSTVYACAITVFGWQVESESGTWGTRWRPLRLVIASVSMLGSLYFIGAILEAM